MNKRVIGFIKIFSILVILTLGLVLNGMADTKTPAKSKKLFRVTKVLVSVNPTSFDGICPKRFNFTAKITASGPGIVRYRWLRSDGATAPVKNLVFKRAQTRTVTSIWQLGGPGKTYRGYWKKVEIVSPNPVVSNRALFDLTCRMVAIAPTYAIRGNVNGGTEGRLIRERKVKVLLKHGGSTFMSRTLTLDSNGSADYAFSGPMLRPATYTLSVEKVDSNPDTLTNTLNVCFNGTTPATRTVTLSSTTREVNNQDFVINFVIAWDRDLCW
jgi:hypothetical protein